MNRRWAAALVIVGVCVLSGAAVSAVWLRFPWVFSPEYTLKVARPIFGDGQRFLTALLRDVAEEYPRLRFSVTPTPDLADSAAALTEGKVDLAVIRCDDEAAGRGRTIVILRKLIVAILVPSNSQLESARGLAGKKVAVAIDAGADDLLVGRIIEFYGLKAPDIVRLPVADVGNALKDKRAVAAIILGPVGAGSIADAITAIRKVSKAAPKFLDIAEAETIAKRNPVYDATEIPQGAFGGLPLEPEEAISTVAVTILLVARASLPNYVAGELARVILSTKARLLATFPAAGQIEAPDTEKTSTLPVHPGTLAYLNGEQKSLFEQSQEFLYPGTIVLGVLGSIAGWVFGLFRKGGPDQAATQLARLPVLLRASQDSSSPERSVQIDCELDEISAWLYESLLGGNIDPVLFQSAAVMISQIRAADERRRQRGAMEVA